MKNKVLIALGALVLLAGAAVYMLRNDLKDLSLRRHSSFRIPRDCTAFVTIYPKRMTGDAGAMLDLLRDLISKRLDLNPRPEPAAFRAIESASICSDRSGLTFLGRIKKPADLRKLLEEGAKARRQILTEQTEDELFFATDPLLLDAAINAPVEAWNGRFGSDDSVVNIQIDPRTWPAPKGDAGPSRPEIFSLVLSQAYNATATATFKNEGGAIEAAEATEAQITKLLRIKKSRIENGGQHGEPVSPFEVALGEVIDGIQQRRSGKVLTLQAIIVPRVRQILLAQGAALIGGGGQRPQF